MWRKKPNVQTCAPQTPDGANAPDPVRLMVEPDTSKYHPWIQFIIRKVHGDAAAPVGKKTKKFRVYWGIFWGGIFLILLAVVLEAKGIPNYKAFNDGYGVWSKKSLVAFMKEWGFAFVIAWAISYLIDKQAKEREHEAHTESNKQMAENVVHAVFGLQHAIPYVRKVVERTLKSEVVREHYQTHYSITSLTPDEVQKYGLQPDRFVKLTQRSKYSFRNVSAQTVNFVVRYAIAVRGGTLQDAAGVTYVTIGGKRIPDGALKRSMKIVGDGYKAYAWDTKINPGAKNSLEILVEAVSFKELSDTEVWGNYHPTYEGMDMTVRIDVPDIARFGIRALTATEPECLFRNDLEAQWVIRGPILPNDSVVFWWRSKADDGGDIVPNQSVKRTRAKKGAMVVATDKPAVPTTTVKPIPVIDDEGRDEAASSGTVARQARTDETS